ncbi:hypothetical protein SETIT_8G163300v2 [Setaria italica]|uniref:Bifunctional inhibitor/plant lipid transfer protein/seed storage helical domain-containing protein n=1 Tax=Setaria italica TaxID=4555 RepID=K3ZLG8_SETIT|nr:non-specific lipid-transfer protein C6 [Setaria italica]RCV38696.1 hypothetical protein SETIT_8G163300v2 [Setaria italica]
MASSSKLPLLFLLLVAAAVLAPPAQAAPQVYCGDSLSGLMECRSFMFGGAAAPSPACCAAYEATFDANPFCLCYVADGTFGRATGYDVNVSDALRIPAACNQFQPPIELCAMQGLVLPPYAPEGTRAQPPATAAAAPTALPPSGSSEAPPSFTYPPPPAPTSKADPSEDAFLLLVATAILWALL